MFQHSSPVGRPGHANWDEASEQLTLVLIQFQGHDLPLSLVELRELTGLRKNVLLRVLSAARQRGDLVQAGPYQWRLSQGG
ncbi:hypothetical protein [Roseomonas elaeocarpi]|uniref:MarR family transcriptional regulator n=1 Tax=Roseomonas elaeocarpi TaxID=907779 RepID=A0ABV6JYD0_9PROT